MKFVLSFYRENSLACSEICLKTRYQGFLKFLNSQAIISQIQSSFGMSSFITITLGENFWEICKIFRYNVWVTSWTYTQTLYIRNNTLLPLYVHRLIKFNIDLSCLLSLFTIGNYPQPFDPQGRLFTRQLIDPTLKTIKDTKNMVTPLV